MPYAPKAITRTPAPLRSILRLLDVEAVLAMCCPLTESRRPLWNLVNAKSTSVVQPTFLLIGTNELITWGNIACHKKHCDGGFRVNHDVKAPRKSDSLLPSEAMEKLMRTLLLTALVATATPLAAEPPKPAPVRHSATDRQPATLTLASNDALHPGVADAVQHGPPLNHRIARVTTCRCGDPQPSAESDSEQQ